MKKIYILLSLAMGVISMSKADAQAGSYSFAATSGTFTPITGATDVAVLLGDFKTSGVIPLGFTFNFDGVDYTDIKAASDGFITFASGGGTTGTNNLDATSSSRRPLIAPLWDDLDGSATGGSGASYVTSGTAPNRTFTFEWLNWEWKYNSTDPVISFQVILHETTNVIDFVYRGETGTISSGSASIGLTGVSTFLSLDGVGVAPGSSNVTETSSLNAKPADGQTYTFTPPTCPAPIAVMTNNLTSTGTDITWTTGGASNWNLEYGPAGFTPGSGTMEINITIPFTITPLTATTDYDVYVQDSCGTGDVSSWSKLSFTTPCGAITPAHNENFTSMTSSVMPACWEEATNGTPISGATGIGSGAWASDGFLNNTSTGAARINLYSNSKKDWMFSPEFDMTGTTTWELGIDVGVTAYSGSAAATMGSDDEVIILATGDNGTTWDTLEIFNTSNTPSNTGDTKLYDLSSYTTTLKIAIWGNEGSTNDPEDYNFYVDNFDIHVRPACAAPSAVAVNNITVISAEVSWTGNAANSNIEYGPSGFTQGTGTIVINAANPFTVSSLTAYTSYDVYVQDSCGMGDVSDWTSVVNFITLPAAHAFPLTEDFEDNTLFFDNKASSATPWVLTTALAHAGTQSMFNGYGGNNNNILHETGILDLSSTGAPVLEFWHIAKTEGGYDKCYVEISIDGGQSYTIIPSSKYRGAGNYSTYFHEDSYADWGTLSTTVINNSMWRKETFDLSSYNVADVRVRFRLTADGSAQREGWYIDDLAIYEPTCPLPYDLTEVYQAEDSVILSWTPGFNETMWNIEYGIAGFTQGSGTVKPVTAATDTIDGLSLGAVYEFYVQADCGGGDASGWVGPILVATPVSNDSTCDAIFIEPNAELSTISYFSNIGATLQTNENSVLSGAQYNTVWFKTVVPASGHLIVAACASDFNARIKAYAYDTIICDSMETYGELTYDHTVCSGGGFDICGATPGDTIMFYVGGSSSSQSGIIGLQITDRSVEGMAGQGDANPVSVCAGDTVNLMGHITGQESFGNWTYPSNTSAIVNDSTINTGALTLTGDSVYYIINGYCDKDTATVVIDAVSITNTGTALANYTECNAGDVFLFNGLTGTVDAGGTWSDDTHTNLLVNNKFVASGLPSGAYQFTYTVDNGICPAASTQTTVNLVDCTNITEEGEANFTIYPNPNNGTFFISNGGNSSNVSMEVVDVQGKVVYTNSFNLTAGTQQEISLGNVETGVYLVRVITNNKVINNTVIVK